MPHSTTLTPLRLLLIEDSTDDELIMLYALREAGFMVEHRRIETEAELRAALDEGNWQAVISDHNLPNFNGLTALKIVRNWSKHVPFLFVSGIVRDDVGIQAMAGGANDYLLKDNLARLGPALARELNEAQSRQVGRINAAHYENILNNTIDAIISIDEAERIILFNRGAERMFGYHADDMLGQPLNTLLPKRFAATHEQHLRAFAESGLPAKTLSNTRELSGRRRDGYEFPAEINVSRTVVEGQTTFTAILRDITERYQAEQALRKSEMRFRLMTNNIKDYAIIMLDLDGRIMSWNAGAQRITGYHAHEIVGQPVTLFYTRQDIAAGRHATLLAQARSEGRTEDEGWRVRKDGSEFYANVVITAMHDDTGELIGFGKITRDITERKALEDALKRHNEELEARVSERTLELEQARQEAERLARAKSDFLANMSHEIRTPMNAVLGLAYLLGQMTLPAEAAELARKIHSSGQSLLGIINDILDFSKIESGRLEIERAPFYLGDILDNLATIMASAAMGKGLELIIAPPPYHACYLIGDALRVGQVLINLTSNAIKFTTSGLVEVKINLLEEYDHKVKLRFSVHDTGIGMDAETQARLFVPFAQADVSTTRRFGGTGLGLVISRRLIEMMGGDISLSSAVNRGSTFSFTLDLPRQGASSPGPQALPDLHVLAVDDNPISLEGLGATIRSMGWTPELLESGEAVVQRVLRDRRLQGPDTILLLDWKMPGLDGLGVARALCERLPQTARPVMLLVSAYSRELIQAQPDVECVDAMLSKPLGPSMIYDTIVRTRNFRLNGAPPPPRPSSVQRLAGLRILVVDDSEINREVAQRIFGHEGAIITLVDDGQQALDWLNSHPHAVDAVLMDVHMPVMDGLEATRRLRCQPEMAKLPIIALTAGALQEQRDTALAAGMSGFIPKPFVVDSAVALILALVRAPEGSRPDPAQALAAETTASGQALLNSDFGLSLFKTLLSYHRYLRLFVQQYQPALAILAQPGPEAGSLEALAHKLRGTAANLGLERVAASAGTVEVLLKQRKEARDEIVRLHDDLAETLRAVGEYLPIEEPPATPQPTAATIDHELITPLLVRALAGMATYNPEAVEPELAQLGHYLPAESLAPLSAALERFSFDEAETALRQLAAELDIPLEN